MTKKFVLHLVVEADNMHQAMNKIVTEGTPEHFSVHDPEQCCVCLGCGITEVVGWDYGKDCSCAAGNPPPLEFNGMHETHCGLQPCPAGCPPEWDKWEKLNHVS